MKGRLTSEATNNPLDSCKCTSQEWLRICENSCFVRGCPFRYLYWPWPLDDTGWSKNNWSKVIPTLFLKRVLFRNRFVLVFWRWTGKNLKSDKDAHNLFLEIFTLFNPVFTSWYVWSVSTHNISPDMWFPTIWHFDKCRLRRACEASF